jgi:phage-related protein (TIGR01555 family)
MVDRFDDWYNTMTSLGSVRDKAQGLSFQKRTRLARHVLEAAYEQNPIVARVVDRLPDDALRHGWKLVGTNAEVDMDEIQSKLDDLNIDQILSQAVKWSRLYGGALIAIPAVDGKPYDQPLCMQDIDALYSPIVFSAHEAQPVDMDATFGSPTYKKVLTYDLSGIDGRITRIHHSRCIAMEAISLPYEALQSSPTGWGPSIIDRLWDDLSREGAARAYANSMMYNASLLYVQLDGFRAAHATKDGRENIQQLLLKMRQSLDALGILGIDAADNIGNVSLTMNGVVDIIDRARNALAAAADMPKEILFNESPAGLNAGKLSGPQELWFAHVASFQKNVLTPALNRLLEICFAAWGVQLDEWTVEWNQLWTKSDADAATINFQQAQADSIYVAMGAVTAEEVREHRLKKGLSGQLVVSDMPEPLDLRGLAEPVETEPMVADYAPPDGETPMSAGELAEITGFSANSIRSMHKRGDIGGWRIGGRWRFLKSEILKAAHQPATPPEPSPAG